MWNWVAVISEQMITITLLFPSNLREQVKYCTGVFELSHQGNPLKLIHGKVLLSI